MFSRMCFDNSGSGLSEDRLSQSPYLENGNTGSVVFPGNAPLRSCGYLWLGCLEFVPQRQELSLAVVKIHTTCCRISQQTKA